MDTTKKFKLYTTLMLCPPNVVLYECITGLERFSWKHENIYVRVYHSIDMNSYWLRVMDKHNRPIMQTYGWPARVIYNNARSANIVQGR